jgi:transposase
VVATKKPQKEVLKMELYGGMDFHSRDTYLGILDGNFKRVLGKRVVNDLSTISNTLEPFRDELKGMVVESTYNWYWLVDGLMDAGYGDIHLANPSAIKQYERFEYLIQVTDCLCR